MAYLICIEPCVGCDQPFSFHPNLVPSLRETPGGPRRPICRTCVERANPVRVANGLEPIVILPGAYQPADENDVDWSDDIPTPLPDPELKTFRRSCEGKPQNPH